MNTNYTQKQLNNALRILAEIWEDNPTFANLPQESKNNLAKIMLQVFDIKGKKSI
jgi:hypothetical protein